MQTEVVVATPAFGVALMTATKLEGEIVVNGRDNSQSRRQPSITS